MNPGGPHGRGLVIALLIVMGLAVAGGGGYGLYAQLTRHAAAAEASAAGQQEIGTRWLRLTAGQIFPHTVAYTSSQTGGPWSAHLVGIAPRASCPAATDPAIGTALAKSGCLALLRATYADVSGTLIATVGIAAMPSPTAAAGALPGTGTSNQASREAGVDAIGFPGTVSDLFGNAQRALFANQVQGPYIFFDSVGFADGRVTHAGGNDTALQDMGSGIINALEVILDAVGQPCQEKDIRC